MLEPRTLRLRESMMILDGGAGAELPDGKGGPVLAGPEAIFIAGRVAADADTVVRFADELGCPHGFVEAYSGVLATPDRRVRLVTVTDDLLTEVPVAGASTKVTIYVDDRTEPDQVVLALTAPDTP